MLIGPTLSPHSPHSLPILYTTTRAGLRPWVECVAPPCGNEWEWGVVGIYSPRGALREWICSRDAKEYSFRWAHGFMCSPSSTLESNHLILHGWDLLMLYFFACRLVHLGGRSTALLITAGLHHWLVVTKRSSALECATDQCWQNAHHHRFML